MGGNEILQGSQEENTDMMTAALTPHVPG